MTKQEQIKEMADFLFDSAEDYCEADGHIITNKLAEALYNAGYRKVGEKFCLKHSEKDYYLTEEDAKGEKACEDCRRQTERKTAHRICIKLLLLYSKINKGRTDVDIIKHDLTAILLNISSAYQIEMPEVFPRR